MRSFFLLTAAVAMIFNMGCATYGTQVQHDPYVWLEEIESPRALDWVQKENDRTLAHFEKNPSYQEIQKEALEIMSNQDRIPYISFAGKWVYNFWTDEKNPRGLLRRTTYENYKTKRPKWEVVLDVDQLNKKENKSWVFRGCRYFKPESKTCLMFLSDGGRDATEVREFNPDTRKFVQAPEGFFIPTGKVRAAWVDGDSILVGTDFGANTISQSGYPIQVKYWKRGTKLEEASLVYQTKPDNMMVFPLTECNAEACETFIGNVVSFYETHYYWWKNRSELVKVDLPPVFQYEGFFRNHIYINLIKDLNVNGKKYAKGSLLKAPLGDWKNLTEVFTPKEKVFFQNVNFSKSHMYLSTLENVNPKVYRDGVPFPAPSVGDAHVASVDRYSNRVLISFENPLNPPSLYEWNDSKIQMVKSLPSQFESQNLKVEQLEAKSADGTVIPYFLIRSKFSRGPGPTMITAYGGFQIPLYPRYDSVLGKAWLNRGGQYVIANIRGGGEFGPQWHESALKEKRQNAFNDLFAVTEDLFKKGLSTSARTSFVGGSNGGLLAGVAYTQKPDLYRAIVSNVPLLDMARYHKLLAGHSWVSEYGNPENKSELQNLLKYSPYHNVHKDKDYSSLFLMTSTKDDRVHPAHARKFGARLKELGIPFYYYENIEGGHGGAADMKQRAKFIALQYTFFLEQLGMQ